jgi:cytochrome c553
MPNPLIRIVLTCAAVLTATTAHADREAGRQKAQLCATCHGPMGMGTIANTPNLAGQPEVYLSEQLKAYRSGKRVHDTMTLIAKPLTDDDIANLAAWYAAIQVELKDKP